VLDAVAVKVTVDLLAAVAGAVRLTVSTDVGGRSVVTLTVLLATDRFPAASFAMT